jgi:hypothetical protein
LSKINALSIAIRGPGSAVLVSCTLSANGQSIVCEMSTAQSTKARSSRVGVRVTIAGHKARMTVPLGKQAKLKLKARR